MALKLPIGIQDFEKLRTGNFVYVDKTALIYPLLTTNSYFLSRPRRFGKSLLISTLRYIFEGRRDLFKGLWLENQWDWDPKSPVIRLSFDAIGHKNLGLKPALLYALEQIATSFGAELTIKEPSTAFKELIQKVAAKVGKVVILIDEYDRPIIDFLDFKSLPQAHENRAILKSFFSILKSEDANIRFLFLTGISKFSKVSIFSDLNHLQDLSPMNDFNNICGYTQAYFHSIIYLTFVLLGVHIQAEVNFSDGRLDAIVHTPERLFIFEFKLHESAEAALQQIKNKDYAASYRALNKTIVGVGVKFSETEKGLENWVSEDI